MNENANESLYVGFAPTGRDLSLPPDARSIWERGPGGLITTDAVIGETWTFLRRHTGHRTADEFVDAATKLRIWTIRLVM